MKKSMPLKSMEMMFMVPQVMATRMAMMTQTDAKPSKALAQEYYGMWAEKTLAFSEAGSAIYLEAMRAQMKWANAMIALCFSPLGSWQKMSDMTLKHSRTANQRMASKGLSPIHKKVSANAKRLRNKKG